MLGTPLRHVRANTVAYLALFVSLSGAAIAATDFPPNSIGTVQLKDRSVTGRKVALHTLTGANIARSSLMTAQLANGAVTNTKLANRAVTNNKLANSALTVTAGAGLSGGGPIPLGGTGALSVDPTLVQDRISGTCAAASAVTQVNQDGTVACGAAGARDIGAVSPGTAPKFRPEGLRGWRGVTHFATGEYCLTPDASTTTSNAVVLVSLGTEAGPGVGVVTLGGVCGGVSPLAFVIVTLDSSFHPSDAIPFTAVIP